MIKKLPTELFNEIYRQVPRLCVDIIIYTSQGIVLTKRLIPPCIGMWHIPGGTDQGIAIEIVRARKLLNRKLNKRNFIAITAGFGIMKHKEETCLIRKEYIEI